MNESADAIVFNRRGYNGDQIVIEQINGRFSFIGYRDFKYVFEIDVLDCDMAVLLKWLQERVKTNGR